MNTATPASAGIHPSGIRRTVEHIAARRSEFPSAGVAFGRLAYISIMLLGSRRSLASGASPDRPAVSVAYHLKLLAELSIAVVWMTDPFSVVAPSSRVFALFFAIQPVLALRVSLRAGAGGPLARVGFVTVGLICIVAAVAGAPVEGQMHSLHFHCTERASSLRR